MPTIRANTAVDPSQIADMFNPLAKAFAPPSAKELYAGAKARETAQSIQMVKDLYDYAAQPGFDQALYSRRLAAAGLQNESSSMEAVDRNNASTRYTNAADNARALDQTRLQQAGETSRTMLAPVGEGQTRFVPPSIASAYGVPQSQQGVVKLNEGQIASLPGGGTIAGTPKPLTDAEARGAILRGLPASDQRSVALQGVPVETVMRGGVPTVLPRDQAVGMTPAPSQSDPKYFNYDLPDGKGSGTAVTGPDGKLRDTQSGAELPQGSRTYTANLTGNKADTGLGASAKSATETRLLDLSNLEGSINSLQAIVDKNPGAIGTTGAVMGMGQDMLATAKEAAGLLGPQAQKMLNDVETGNLPPEMRQYFNPNIPQAKLLENTILAQYAKMQDPGGRLSNQQMEIAAKALGSDGFLRSADKTRAVLAGIRQQIEQQRAMLGGVSPAAAAIRPGNAPAARSAAPAGQPVRRRYNPATGALE